MEKPLISVITVCFNASEVIEPTIQSVNEQTFEGYEHLIVDGASTDKTVVLVSQLRTEKTRIVSEPDRGIYDAMNKGLRLARGQYVLFLNAGDSFADRQALADMAERASRGADIVYGDTMIVDAERRIVGRRHLSAPQQLTFKSFSHGMLVCHQAFMVRRELAPDYDTQYRFSADYDWTIRCIEASKVSRCVNVGRPLIHYLSDGMTDRNKLASLKERFRIMRNHYGLPTTLWRHATFVPRALGRKLRR